MHFVTVKKKEETTRTRLLNYYATANYLRSIRKSAEKIVLPPQIGPERKKKMIWGTASTALPFSGPAENESVRNQIKNRFGQKLQ